MQEPATQDHWGHFLDVQLSSDYRADGDGHSSEKVHSF